MALRLLRRRQRCPQLGLGLKYGNVICAYRAHMGMPTSSTEGRHHHWPQRHCRCRTGVTKPDFRLRHARSVFRVLAPRWFGTGGNWKCPMSMDGFSLPQTLGYDALSIPGQALSAFCGAWLAVKALDGNAPLSTHCWLFMKMRCCCVMIGWSHAGSLPTFWGLCEWSAC